MPTPPYRLTDAGLAGLSDRQLRRLVHHVSRRLDDLAQRRLNTGTAAHGVGAGGGLDPVTTMEHNRRLDREAGRAELERELSALTNEIQRREPPPEPLRRSTTRTVVAVGLITGAVTTVIIAVVTLSDRPSVEPVPDDQWQPASTYFADPGEEPYDLRLQVSCWPEVQAQSVVETSQDVRISLRRRGPVESSDPASRHARTCHAAVRLRDVLGDRIVIDATREAEIKISGRN